MNAGHYSSLLPEVFKHKSTRVRIAQPQFILLDFHGTISERRWEDKVIFPYVKHSIKSFVKDNWSHELVQSCFHGLKNESFEQRFRNKHDDAPIIDDVTIDSDELEHDKLASQVGEFLHWQIRNRKETRETQLLSRIVWIDGFKRNKITTPVYEDVLPCLMSWRNHFKCKIYLVSSVDEDTLQILLGSTDKGSLLKHLDGFVCPKRIGEKMVSETYRHFYEKLGVKAIESKTKIHGRGASRSPPTSSEKTNESSSHSSRSARNLSPTASEPLGKPILFITDSGQEAKAASLVADGSAYECLLINRPGNKRIRTYYLSQFQYIERLDDIDFV